MNKYLWFYVYFSDTEASQACFRLLHDADDDDDDDDGVLYSRSNTFISDTLVVHVT